MRFRKVRAPLSLDFSAAALELAPSDAPKPGDLKLAEESLVLKRKLKDIVVVFRGRALCYTDTFLAVGVLRLFARQVSNESISSEVRTPGSKNA
jgi:hypothetical protein